MNPNSRTSDTPLLIGSRLNYGIGSIDLFPKRKKVRDTKSKVSKRERRAVQKRARVARQQARRNRR